MSSGLFPSGEKHITVQTCELLFLFVFLSTNFFRKQWIVPYEKLTTVSRSLARRKAFASSLMRLTQAISVVITGEKVAKSSILPLPLRLCRLNKPILFLNERSPKIFWVHEIITTLYLPAWINGSKFAEAFTTQASHFGARDVATIQQLQPNTYMSARQDTNSLSVQFKLVMSTFV